MTPAGARPAVLFDADGTLTDSDYLHVHAWYRAFSEAGVDVLARDDLVSAVTSSQDVDTATPQPDTVQVALERARVDARDAVFIGDAVWDVEACERAGAPTIAVLSGGVSRGEFETAGAQAVFENASDLCAHLHGTAIGQLAKAVQTA